MTRYPLPRGRTLTLCTGDLTHQQTGAIVNAANTTLLGGGGVDGAIHRAAGRGLLAACRALPEVTPGVRCPTGEARITPGFDLPTAHVIHAVGPVYASHSHSAPLLRSAWTAALDLAADNGVHSIAFPAISCGVYRYPASDAAEVSLLAARDHAGDVPDIRVVLFDAVMFQTWDRVAQRMFKGRGSDLVELWRTDAIEGPILLGALRHHGLNPTLQGQGLASIVGASQAVVPVRLMIPEHQRDEAEVLLAILREASEDQAEADRPSQCEACGAAWEPGFDVCWQCQHEP